MNTNIATTKMLKHYNKGKNVNVVGYASDIAEIFKNLMGFSSIKIGAITFDNCDGYDGIHIISLDNEGNVYIEAERTMLCMGDVYYDVDIIDRVMYTEDGKIETIE